MSRIHECHEIAQHLLREYPHSNKQEVNQLAFHVVRDSFGLEKAAEYLNRLNRDRSDDNPTRAQLDQLTLLITTSTL